MNVNGAHNESCRVIETSSRLMLNAHVIGRGTALLFADAADCAHSEDSIAESLFRKSCNIIGTLQ